MSSDLKSAVTRRDVLKASGAACLAGVVPVTVWAEPSSAANTIARIGLVTDCHYAAVEV